MASVAVTVAGTYTTVPTVAFTGAASTIAASAAATLQVQGTPTVGAGGANYHVGDSVLFTNGVVLIVATLAGSAVATWQPVSFLGASPGAVTSGATPANPVVQLSTSGTGTGATANLTWGVGVVQVLNQGAGYTSTPTVTFSPAGASATATLAANSNGFPSVPSFFQQRLVLAAPTGAPQTFYMSQPGAYFNFNVSSPSEATDSITGTLVSGQLNTIKSMVSQTTGLLILTVKASWLITGVVMVPLSARVHSLLTPNHSMGPRMFRLSYLTSMSFMYSQRFDRLTIPLTIYTLTFLLGQISRLYHLNYSTATPSSNGHGLRNPSK